MYAAFLATLVVMLRSRNAGGRSSVWLLVVLFILFNAFSSLTSIHAIATDSIDVLDFSRVLQREWYNTRFVPGS